jgi:hypothetical protein
LLLHIGQAVYPAYFGNTSIVHPMQALISGMLHSSASLVHLEQSPHYRKHLTPRIKPGRISFFSHDTCPVQYHGANFEEKG